MAGSRSPRQRLAASQTLIVRLDPPKTKGPAARGRVDTGRNRGGNATRQEIAARLDAMAGLLRDIGVLTSRADHRRLANADLMSRLDRMSRVFTGERLTRAFSAVDQARAALERNASHKLVADWLALHL